MAPPPLRRRDIFRRFPWLAKQDQLMVLSADVDGLLSATLLHHHLGWRVAGYYDCATLWLSRQGLAHRAELVFIDLDIARPGCPSLGHHILTMDIHIPAGLGHICNPNLLAGIGVDRFTDKYPFSTVLFLLWLHEIALRHSLMARLLVLHADSSWLNARRYGENCRVWQRRLPDFDWRWLFQQVAAPQFQRRMEDQLYVRLERLGIPRSVPAGQGQPGNQLRLNPDWDDDLILGLYDLAGTYLKWSPPPAPSMDHRLEGRRESAALRTVAPEGLPAWVKAKGVFSYAITSRDTLNFTILDW